MLGVRLDHSEQGPPPPRVRAAVGDVVGDDDGPALVEKALRVVCGRDVGRLDDHARCDRGRVLGRDGVRNRSRHDDVGVDLEPAFPRQLAVARP